MVQGNVTCTCLPLAMRNSEPITLFAENSVPIFPYGLVPEALQDARDFIRGAFVRNFELTGGVRAAFFRNGPLT